jgi:thymidylate synthase
MLANWVPDVGREYGRGRLWLENVDRMKPPLVIVEDHLDTAHFEVCRRAFKEPYSKVYQIDQGSFQGHLRYQIESLTMVIMNPEHRPIVPLLGPGFPQVISDVEEYFHHYIIGTEVAPSETYTYGQFIWPHLQGIVELLMESPGTNQAVINIGNSIEMRRNIINVPQDELTNTELPIEIRIEASIEPVQYVGKNGESDPPCLRCITWQVNDEGKLDIYTFWRSWDLFAGMPMNLAGIQLLNEYVAGFIGREPGAQVCYSSGSHVYDTAKDYVR